MIELDDIVKIVEIEEINCTIFWTKTGHWACSCGESGEDSDYVYREGQSIRIQS